MKSSTKFITMTIASWIALIAQAYFLDIFDTKTEVLLAAVVLLLFDGFYVLLGKDE